VVNSTRKINVKIPAGVDNGTNIRLVNQGDAGAKGGKPGHLFIRLAVPEDKTFRREGTNVHTDVPISIAQAVLGGTVKVPTIGGSEVEIKVTPILPPQILNSPYRSLQARNPKSSVFSVAREFRQLAALKRAAINTSTSKWLCQRASCRMY
jgi:hypothetical protein